MKRTTLAILLLITLRSICLADDTSILLKTTQFVSYTLVADLAADVPLDGDYGASVSKLKESKVIFQTVDGNTPDPLRSPQIQFATIVDSPGIPEPGTFLLIAAGLLAIARISKKRRQ